MKYFIFTCALLYLVSCKKKEEPADEKPVIYFYPEKHQKIQATIKAQNPENMTFSYPKLNEYWNFVAEPNGNLIFSDGKNYPYLFWEAQAEENNVDFNEGFVVQKENLIHFFEEKLNILGLQTKEQADFITYWAPRMSKYDQVQLHFAIASNQMTNELGKDFENRFNLHVDPQPDTKIRILMYWKPCLNQTKINVQNLPRLTRKGFTVIEWGGVELKNEIIF